eukprot:scaffold224113_cov15-Tisochrysis_lutea.AAC.1
MGGPCLVRFEGTCCASFQTQATLKKKTGGASPSLTEPVFYVSRDTKPVTTLKHAMMYMMYTRV